MLNSACTASGYCCGAAQTVSAAISAGASSVRPPAFSAGARLRRCCQTLKKSMAAASAARISSSQTVPGTLPVCRIASVSAP